jgi:3-oxoadipate enol-lactonase
VELNPLPNAQSNGISIYYEIHGEGEPLLLIGGLGADLTQLEGIGRELSKSFRVIKFDNRGAGRTDKPDAAYSIEMMAEDASGLLDALGISSVHVLGVSLGGRIATMLALLHPNQVKSLILLSTSAKMSQHRGLSWSLSNQLIRIPMVRGFGTKYKQPYYAYVRQRDASRGFDVTGRLKEIVKPALILHGTKDRIVPYRLAEEMHAGIPGSRLESFDGGHLVVFSEPENLAKPIKEFLLSLNNRTD